MSHVHGLACRLCNDEGATRLPAPAPYPSVRSILWDEKQHLIGCNLQHIYRSSIKLFVNAETLALFNSRYEPINGTPHGEGGGRMGQNTFQKL